MINEFFDFSKLSNQYESAYQMVNGCSRQEHQFKSTNDLINERTSLFDQLFSEKIDIYEFNYRVDEIEDQLCRNDVFNKGILSLCGTGK